MRTILYHLAAPLLAAALSMAATSAAAQNFQRQFGTAFDNAFVKVVRHGTNYYVLGRDQNAAGALSRATVTRLNNNGVVQWTRSLNIASGWNDAVLAPNGNLVLVGATLPIDASNQSLMGVLTPAGTFSWLRSFDAPNREAFTKIVRNPSPQNASFPYYVLGLQAEPNGSATMEDVVLLNVSEAGTFNWKKLFNLPGSDDEFFKDLEAMPNGDLMMCGNQGTNGMIFRVDNTGNLVGGATPFTASISYSDLSRSSTGGFFAVATTIGGGAPYVMKYDSDLIPLWEMTLSGVTSVNQVWEEPTNGWIYVMGRGVFNGQNRAVVMRFIEAGGQPGLDWARFLDNGETSYVAGLTTLLPPNQIAFVDGRTPTSGGFGQLCAFMSVSDLELASCITDDGFVGVNNVSLSYNSPASLPVTFFDTPIPTDVANAGITWQQAEVCNNAPCVAAFTSAPIGACGNFQFTNQSTGPTPPPLTYLWNFGDPMSGANNTSTATNPTHQFSKCGTYTVCLTVTAATCTASVCHTVVVTDNVLPTAVCKPGVGVSLDPIDCTYTVTPAFVDGGSSDNCPNWTLSVSPKELTGCKNHTVTLTVTDWCGNTKTCTMGIQTLEVVPPKIVCPPNISLKCSQQLPPFFTGIATVTDNCTPNMVAAYTDAVSGIMPCNATVLRTWTATDSCGNSTACTQVITVRDDIPPTISCPQNVSVNTLPGLCYYTFVHLQQIGVTATDNCDVPAIICTWEDSNGTILPYTLQTQLPKGVLKFRCFSRDQCGNVSPTCTFTVTVTDNEPPMITCPQNLSVTGTINPQGLCKATVNGIAATATDNCPMLNLSYTTVPPANGGGSSDASGAMFMQGVTTVTYTATDMAGSKTTCSFTVTVECPPVVDKKCGWTVATCYGYTPGSPVGVIYDTRFNSAAVPGADWGATLNAPATSIHPPDWKNNIIGNVFGIATDNVDKIFLAASDVYRLDAGLTAAYGPGGPAGVYKTDCSPPYATTPIIGSLSVPIYNIVGTGIPGGTDIGNGYGNIAYDPVHSQLFLTNLEDGRIYRIDPNGNLKSAYDPFAIDGGVPGKVTAEERLWGIGIFNSRVYFAREQSGTNPKQIWSIGLDGTGEFIATTTGGNLFNGPAQLEINNGPGIQSKYTDIAFCQTGRMLLAERGNPHSAGVFEYQLVGPNWVSANTFKVGRLNGGTNSAGGVDYGYREQGGDPKAVCNGLVWASANCMDPVGVPGAACQVYGLEGISAAGNTHPANASTDIYLDFDGLYNVNPKNQIGDVEQFKCGCPSPPTACDSISVTSMPMNNPAVQDTCCFKLTYHNQKPNYFTGIQLCAGPGVSFSAVSVLGSCVLNSFNGAQITVLPAGGLGSTFPAGSKDFVKFCLSNYQSVAQQLVIVKYLGPNLKEVCRDTLKYQCSQKPKCMKFTGEATCLPDGKYKMTFCVMTHAQIPFSVTSFVLNAPAGITFTPNVFVPNPNPMLPNTMQCNFMATVSGPAALDGAKICFSITAKNGVLGQSDTDCCTDTVMLACVTLPTCVCNKVSATAVPMSMPPDKCCWKVTLTNNYQNNFFQCVDLDILTPGVVFGAFYGNLSWNLASNPVHATLTKFPAAFFGPSETLPVFCLSGMTGPAQVPQEVEVKWKDANGKIICRDTLRFFCPWPDSNDCAVLVCPRIECDSTTPGIYTLTFQVQNNSWFPINQVVLTNTGGGLISPSTFNIPSLGIGGTSGVLTAQIFGLLPGQQICFNLSVHQIGSNGSQLNCCTHSTPYCFYMPECGFCPGNWVQNGDFEMGVPDGTDESINLAADWDRIWPAPHGLSTADFWNTLGQNPTAGIGLPTPNPVGQNNFAGFWCHNTTNLSFREGILNTLVSPIPQNSGLYNLSMKLACMDNSLPGASMSVFGVPTGAPTALSGTNPLTGNAPPNAGLFSPAAVLLATYPIPIGCNAAFTTLNFPPINSSAFPAAGIDRIFLTRTDGVSGKAYLAVDDVCLKGKPTCCQCGPFEFLYSIGHGPLWIRHCGDDLYVSDILPMSFSASFHCQGTECPAGAPPVDYVLTGPAGFTTLTGTVPATPSLSLPISQATFTKPGTYCLMLTGHCGTNLCPCKIYFVYPNPCCKDKDVFCQHVENAVSVTTDNNLCKATLNIGNLPACDQIAWVNWGQGPVQFGPFMSGTMPMHTYTGSGTYIISYLAEEYDYSVMPPKLCFEKLLRDTITLVCDSCDCKLFTGTQFYNNNWPGITQNVTCGNAGVVTLPCLKPGTNPLFFFHGNLNCNLQNCISSSVNWAIVQMPGGGPVASGTTNAFPINPTSSHFDINLNQGWFSPGVDYMLTVTGLCGSITCACKINFRFEQCPSNCVCDKWKHIKIVNKKLTPVLNKALNCGDPAMFVPCPEPGKPHTLTGMLACLPTGCTGSMISWTMFYPNGNPVPGGSGTAPGPWFSISITNLMVAAQNGTYTIKLTGKCGTQVCMCELKLIFDGCPPVAEPCPCDEKSFFAALNACFYMSSYNQFNCTRCFKANKLLPCDSIYWSIKVNGVQTPIGATLGTGTLCHTFNASGAYTICMRVVRRGANGQICQQGMICQKITVSCPGGPDPSTCVAPLNENGGFVQDATPGILGSGGTTAGWQKTTGEPRVVLEPGFTDFAYILAPGNCIKASGISTKSMDLPKGWYWVKLAYQSQNPAPLLGTRLIAHLSDMPLTSDSCVGICREIGSWEIQSDSSGWYTIEHGFRVDTSEDSKFHHLSLTVTNDLIDDDPLTLSNVAIDNVCIENRNWDVTGTNELRLEKWPLRIFPNPNSGLFTVELPQPAIPGMAFRVTDLAGRLVLQKQTEAGSQQQTVQTGDLLDGLYFLQVVQDGRVLAVEKFVKQH